MAKSLALKRPMAGAGAPDSEAKPALQAESSAAPTSDNTFQVNLFMAQFMLKAYGRACQETSALDDSPQGLRHVSLAASDPHARGHELAEGSGLPRKHAMV